MLSFNEAEERKNRIKDTWKKKNDKVETSLATLKNNVMERNVFLFNGREYCITLFEKRFAESYVKHCSNVKKAMEEAKVSKGLAMSILYDKKKHIIAREYIRSLQKEQEKIVKKEMGYTALQSFKEFIKVQEMATKVKKFIVNKKTGTVKTVRGNPDLAAYLKAEEQKGKLYGLYKEAEDDKVKTIMNIVVGNAPTIGMQKLNKDDSLEAEVLGG